MSFRNSDISLIIEGWWNLINEEVKGRGALLHSKDIIFLGCDKQKFQRILGTQGLRRNIIVLYWKYCVQELRLFRNSGNNGTFKRKQRLYVWPQEKMENSRGGCID